MARERTRPLTAIQAEAEKLMKAVYDKGFNVYMMLNKLKKDARLPSNVPAEVIVRVCAAWLKTNGKDKSYPWFVKAFVMSSQDFFAKEQVAKGIKYKAQKDYSTLKEIMRRWARE